MIMPSHFTDEEAALMTDQHFFRAKAQIMAKVRHLLAATHAALKEREALASRVGAARDLASFAVGTATDEYLTREARDKSKIEEYERQMTVGEKRIADLDQQIVGLATLQDLSRRYFPEAEK